MLMHRAIKQYACDGSRQVEVIPTQLKAEPFTPLTARLKSGNAEVAGALERLKAMLSAQEFDQYIESLLNVSMDGKTVWMITDSLMQRSIMERNLVASIKAAFRTESVRILAS